MKLFTKFAGVSAVAALVSSSAFGAFTGTVPSTQINIVGSTAFRAATYAAVADSLVAGYQVASVGALPGAGQAVFMGTTKTGSVPVIIRTAFSGSVGGIQAVQGATLTAFLDETAAGVNNGSTAATGTKNIAPNVTMSDSSQASAAIVDPTVGSPSLTGSKVGVIPFRWVASPASGLKNITALGAQAALQGLASVSFFIPGSTDTTPVYAIGRNNDSGTRLAAFAESGFGPGSLPYQFLPVVTGQNGSGYLGTINTAAPYLPAAPNAGNGGYSSGGTVAKVITAAYGSAVISDELGNSLANGPFVTYVGETDSNNAINNGAVELTYNGVLMTYANVQNGSYTFWTYEYIYGKGITGSTLTAFNALTANIKLDAAASGVKLTDMHCSRSGEGLVVVPQ